MIGPNPGIPTTLFHPLAGPDYITRYPRMYIIISVIVFMINSSVVTAVVPVLSVTRRLQSIKDSNLNWTGIHCSIILCRLCTKTYRSWNYDTWFGRRGIDDMCPLYARKPSDGWILLVRRPYNTDWNNTYRSSPPSDDHEFLPFVLSAYVYHCHVFII